MLIRYEVPADIDAIRELNYTAFKDHPHHEPGAEPTEHLIVDRLREATLSLVVEDDGHVVGHIAISPVTMDEIREGWFGLGPVAVEPKLQGKGIGANLIRTAIKAMEDRGMAGMVVLGEPEYYSRFGFKQDSSIQLPGVPPEYFMAMTLKDVNASGNVAYHSAFN